MTRHEYIRQVAQRFHREVDTIHTPLSNMVKEVAYLCIIHHVPTFDALMIETRNQLINIKESGAVKFDQFQRVK